MRSAALAPENSSPSEVARDAMAGGAPLRHMRLLVLMPSIPLQGMERANLEIVRLLHEKGADALFVTEANFGQRVAKEVEHLGLRWAPVSLLKSSDERPRFALEPLSLFRILHAWCRASREIGQIARRYRPTHIQVTNPLYLLYALPLLVRGRVPVVLRTPNPPDASFRRIRKLGHDAFWRRLVPRLTDLIVCNSAYTRGRLIEVGIPPEKLRVIYNTVPQRPPGSANDAPRLDPSHFHIAYLGRIRPNKGVALLHKAAIRLVADRDDVEFHFVGEYEWKNPFAEDLIADTRCRGLESRIRFHGVIEDVFGFLGQCQLHVCPSVSPTESFPNVLLEAKLQGIPSVVFPTAGIPEAVTHLVDGYICPQTTADALAEGIRYYLDRPDARLEAGRAARFSLRRFDREQVGRLWMETYLQLHP